MRSSDGGSGLPVIPCPGCGYMLTLQVRDSERARGFEVAMQVTCPECGLSTFEYSDNLLRRTRYMLALVAVLSIYMSLGAVFAIFSVSLAFRGGGGELIYEYSVAFIALVLVGVGLGLHLCYRLASIRVASIRVRLVISCILLSTLLAGSALFVLGN